MIVTGNLGSLSGQSPEKGPVKINPSASHVTLEYSTAPWYRRCEDWSDGSILVVESSGFPTFSLPFPYDFPRCQGKRRCLGEELYVACIWPVYGLYGASDVVLMWYACAGVPVP